MSATQTLLDCGHTPSPHSDFTTGTAHTPDGREICWDCANSEIAHQVSASVPGDKITLYVSSDGKSIITWPGGVIMTHVTYGERHHRSHERYYLTARDDKGRTWSGTGAGGMWASLRLTSR